MLRLQRGGLLRPSLQLGSSPELASQPEAGDRADRLGEDRRRSACNLQRHQQKRRREGERAEHGHQSSPGRLVENRFGQRGAAAADRIHRESLRLNVEGHRKSDRRDEAAPGGGGRRDPQEGG